MVLAVALLTIMIALAIVALVSWGVFIGLARLTRRVRQTFVKPQPL